MFFDAFWSRPLVTLNNKNGSFSFQKTILLKCSLRVSDEKIELLKKNKAFLKIDWKHHANISEYVRGALDRKTYCFFNRFLIFPIRDDIQKRFAGDRCHSILVMQNNHFLKENKRF